ncbi:MAG: glycosyltransferase family 4 protein [Anaeromyxobacter sp.]|nr:glycosyltransferase family 4 protein [Anaeromyxobacter sp.]
MHVGLNALDLSPGRSGGIETYLRNLLAALQALPAGEDRFTLLALPPVGATLPLHGPAFRRREFACGRPSPGWLLRRGLLRLTGRDLLAPAIDRLGLDVVHHPFTTVNTPGLRGASVLTFHDMQHEFLPGNFTPAELARRRLRYPASARSATRVIAISEHVKGTLVERYGLDPARVDVVHSGCGPEFAPIADPARLAAARRDLGLPRPFLYYPAASWPHKDHLTLLRALRLLLDRRVFDGDLVLTGVAREASGLVGAEIARLGLQDRVRLLGHLPAARLPELYALAEALAFPSRFEGFGFPLVEAFACGCPVVSSDATSLPEVAGGAALLFEAGSAEALAARLTEVLGGGAVRAALRAAGLARAADFSWARAAQQTVESYRRAAASLASSTSAAKSSRWSSTKASST